MAAALQRGGKGGAGLEGPAAGGSCGFVGS